MIVRMGYQHRRSRPWPFREEVRSERANVLAYGMLSQKAGCQEQGAGEKRHNQGQIPWVGLQYCMESNLFLWPWLKSDTEKIAVKENTIPRKDEVRCARCKRAAIMTRYRKMIGKDNWGEFMSLAEQRQKANETAMEILACRDILYANLLWRYTIWQKRKR